MATFLGFFAKKLIEGANLKELNSEQKEICKNLEKFGALDSEKERVRLKENFALGVAIKTRSRAFLSVLGTKNFTELALDFLPSNVFSGDVVLVQILDSKKQKKSKSKRAQNAPSAVFVGVIKFSSAQGVCVLKSIKNNIVALDLKTFKTHHIKASQKSLRQLPKDCVLVLDLRTGAILRVIGVMSDESVDKQILLEQNGIKVEFEKDALQQAQSFGNSVPKGLYKERKDYCKLPFVTIDPKTAKDHDDAIFYDVDSEILYVAIADVSEYVSEFSPLDKAARERAFSVYFPNSVIPMLPFELSANLCSLQKGKNRLALVWEIKLKVSKNAVSVENQRLFKGIIKVAQNIDYDNLQKRLDSENLGQSLSWLDSYKNVAQILKIQRLKNGFEFLNPNFVLQMSGERVKSVRKESHNLAHSIVEESMLLANVAAAKMLNDVSEFGIYRAHEEPKMDKIAQLAHDLQELGVIDFAKNKRKKMQNNLHEFIKTAQKNANEMFKKNSEFREIIDAEIIKSFNKAIYSINLHSHFALGFENYTHFTSPIRRYCDLYIHRILKASLDNLSTKYLSDLSSVIAKEITFKERKIKHIEKDFLSMKFARLAQNLLDSQAHIAGEAVMIDSENLECVFIKSDKKCAQILQGAKINLINNFKQHFYKFQLLKIEIFNVDLTSFKIFAKLTKLKD